MGKTEELPDGTNLTKAEKMKIAQCLSFGFFDENLVKQVIQNLNDDLHYQFSERHHNLNLDEESKHDSGFDESSGEEVIGHLSDQEESKHQSPLRLQEQPVPSPSRQQLLGPSLAKPRDDALNP